MIRRTLRRIAVGCAAMAAFFGAALCVWSVLYLLGRAVAAALGAIGIGMPADTNAWDYADLGLVAAGVLFGVWAAGALFEMRGRRGVDRC
jgi:hypothetical protein